MAKFMTIKILSNSTINKISAGEVIERPASVIKELVENSIDSGASKIEITLECAGKNLIIIKDNGEGMDKCELALAVQRHATSKLDENDLLNIHSFGFRGEALPSIGAISKFKIDSRKKGSGEAFSLSIIGGQQQDIIDSNLQEGTRIEVRDLFFATPARLKFLRTDKTELNACILVLKKIALSHPNVSFSCTHNGKPILSVRTSQDQDQVLNDRIEEILGKEFVENSAPVKLHSDEVSIFGLTSIPTYNRASAEDQFLFINNRPVKDKVLNVAMKVAYQDYLERNRHAVCVLFIKVDPHFVDVNVHPAKSEVRFHDPNLVRRVVISSIKDALNNSSDRVSSKTSDDAINYMQPVQMNSLTAQERAEKNDNFIMPKSLSGASNYKPKFQTSSAASRPDGNITPTKRVDYALSKTNTLIETQPHSNNYSGEIATVKIDKELESNYRLGAAKAQFHGTYIISQTDDSIIITDQHAAHERIGYEKIKSQIAKNGLIKQRLLIPEIVEMPDENRANLLEENKEILAKYGMIIEKFGNKSIIISELPSLIGDINPQKLIHDLGDHFHDMGENIALTELIEHITETYACHYAVRAGKKLNSTEMNELLRQMEDTPFSGQCNHGRQTYVELKLKDIEKLFGRR
ncbi:MAG: hypothetical protein DGJ47_000597 [Rickettsiaceae bacterium]